MNYILIVEDEAELDTLEAFNWYEIEKNGLGEDFVTETENCILNIQNNPLQYQIIYKNIRRALLHKFPYGIFYILEDDKVFVISVTHLKRHPKNWRKRIYKIRK